MMRNDEGLNTLKHLTETSDGDTNKEYKHAKTNKRDRQI